MSSGEALGFISGAIITCGFIPQVLRVYRLRSAHEISLLFTIALILGGILWLTYGIMFVLLPVIIWNALCVVLVLGLLLAKLKYGR